MQKVCVTLLLGILTVPALALDDAVNTGRFNDTAIEGYDPVAYFTEGKPVKGSDEFEYAWRGGNWRFASQDSLERFMADPEKFAPQYGGWCAYGLVLEDSEGYPRGKYPVDQKHFQIIDGRLHLFYREPGYDARELWNRDPAGHRATAEKEWSRISRGSANPSG